MEYVAFILQMPQHALPRVRSLVVPALGIYRIGTEDLQFAAVDLGREHADHAAIFVFEELAHGGGKNEQGLARITEHQVLHVAMKFMAVTLVIFAMHVG